MRRDQRRPVPADAGMPVLDGGGAGLIGRGRGAMRHPTLGCVRKLYRMVCRLVCALAIVAGLATPLAAAPDRFSVSLGGRTLGTLTHDADAQTLTTVLDNSPMGVADGQFEASLRRARTSDGQSVTQYVARGKGRVISILFDGAVAVETVVEPASERTDLSDVARVPDGVLDMVTGVGRLVRGQGCPGGFRMYDGRRVIDVQTLSETRGEGRLQCAVSYRVIAGPGHLSPFRFTDIAVTLDYATTGGQSLQRAQIEAGVFTLQLAR